MGGRWLLGWEMAIGVALRVVVGVALRVAMEVAIRVAVEVAVEVAKGVDSEVDLTDLEGWHFKLLGWLGWPVGWL